MRRPGAGAPAISHYCLGVDGFDVGKILAALAAHGVTKGDAAGPMKAAVTLRRPDAGGATDGTPDLLFGDPDGIVCQLQDASFCGGAGALGNVCPAPESPAKKGPIALRDYSHLTIFSTDAARSNAFYRDLVRLLDPLVPGPDRADARGRTDGAVPDVHRRRRRAGAAPARVRPSINHGCFSLDGFKPDEVVKSLESYGLKPREGTTGAGRPVAALRVDADGESRRRARRTPELYFTDPDGPADAAAGHDLLRRRRIPGRHLQVRPGVARCFNAFRSTV